MTLDLDNIQGNIVPGFNKDHQAFILVRFGDSAAARSWLKDVGGEIASAREVLAFNELFKGIRERRRLQGQDETPWNNHPNNRDYGALRTISATWINVALSLPGIELLNGAKLDEVARASFRSRVHGIHSPSEEADTHALLLVAADWPSDLEEEVRMQLTRLDWYGLKPSRWFRGDVLPDPLRGHEHFGFKDGISQPAIAGTRFGNGAPVAAGEFVLGYPDEHGRTSLNRMPAWSSDGSFLVFLDLEQDVATFREAVHEYFDSAAFASPEQLGAAFIGRWSSGAPAGSSLDAIRSAGTDPGWADTDRYGPPFETYPFSHVGRARPSREDLEPNRHRLIRRGIPYGPPLSQEVVDAERRGLLFLGYQADIGRQFEHVWLQWLNNAHFPQTGAGTDPTVGAVTDSLEFRDVRLRDGNEKGGSIELRLPQFVSLKFGGYFFAPSLAALAELSGASDSNNIAKVNIASEPPNKKTELETRVYPSTSNIFDYDEFLRIENPYPGDARDFTQTGEIDKDGVAAGNNVAKPYLGTMQELVQDPAQFARLLHWNFGGQQYPISKAIRVVYKYTKPGHNGIAEKTVQGSLFIGYQGPEIP